MGFGKTMKITVVGLWHLGCITAACCAEHFEVTGLDFDSRTIDELLGGKAPLSEPGLDALIRAGLDSGKLRFTTDAAKGCAQADLMWVCIDTPVNSDDEPDVEAALNAIRRCVPLLKKDSVVLVSSQLPVGTCKKLEAEFSGIPFACSPENLRLGRALEIFRNPDRIVAGVRNEATRAKLAPLFARFGGNVVWMQTESAEMTKHAINAFLASSISFMNEIGRLCELTGANAAEVERGLKSESRIGPRAYLHAGGAFSGGTLARDIVALSRIAADKQEPLVLIPAIKQSNDQHRQWALRRLRRELSELSDQRIAVLGLTYKPGTDTLRRSLAVELCRGLLAENCDVRAFDPTVHTLPEDLPITLSRSADEALAGADAAVICTERSEFKTINWDVSLPAMRRRLILDANGFLAADLARNPAVRYVVVGIPE
jgi:UDPglucose 6-dehydrogenase